MDRRRFVTLAMAAAGGLVVACDSTGPDAGGDGRLSARAGQPSGTILPGRHLLGLSSVRDGHLYVPTGYTPARPVPLVVLLHGAGGSAQDWSTTVEFFASREGIALLVPESRGQTWDVVSGGGFGADVAFIDDALAQTFQRIAVDPARIALGGFSDGASYALSLGLTNGDLFSRIFAFSPGFMVPGRRTGQPSIFVSHGTQDQILPVTVTRNSIVPQLRDWGYTVEYEEFEGGHSVPGTIIQQVFALV